MSAASEEKAAALRAEAMLDPNSLPALRKARKEKIWQGLHHTAALGPPSPGSGWVTQADFYRAWCLPHDCFTKSTAHHADLRFWYDACANRHYVLVRDAESFRTWCFNYTTMLKVERDRKLEALRRRYDRLGWAIARMEGS